MEFGQCTRDPAMMVAEYVVKLRSLAPPCEFQGALDERLRDQFIMGLKNQCGCVPMVFLVCPFH